MQTVLLLTISNIFMTFAWYGHLKYKSSHIWLAILASWGIAFVEYCFQVPANRIGHDSGFTAAQLKVIQEVITLLVFGAFAILYLKETPRWNEVVGFLLVLLAVFVVFGLGAKTDPELEATTSNTAAVTASNTNLEV
jgi:uncharacterized protein (DUF486 family)